MKITILTIGKTSFPFAEQGIQEYHKRLHRYINAEWKYLPPVKNASSLSEAEIKRTEGEIFLKEMPSGAMVYLLDERGKNYTSEQFAEFIRQQQLASVKQLIFAIGGAYGFSDPVYKRANGQIALSAMTFPHDLIRLFFAEQLYRAMTILRNEPYHHR